MGTAAPGHHDAIVVGGGHNGQVVVATPGGGGGTGIAGHQASRRVLRDRKGHRRTAA